MNGSYFFTAFGCISVLFSINIHILLFRDNERGTHRYVISGHVSQNSANAKSRLAFAAVIRTTSSSEISFSSAIARTT